MKHRPRTNLFSQMLLRQALEQDYASSFNVVRDALAFAVKLRIQKEREQELRRWVRIGKGAHPDDEAERAFAAVRAKPVHRVKQAP